MMQRIEPKDLAHGRRLKAGAIAAPVLLTSIPLVVTLFLTVLAASGPPAAALIFFGGMIATVIGFITGMTITVVLAQKRSVWTKEMRERIAASGIKAEDLNWFRHEIRPSEKRALKAVESRDPLLGDAYRETLASRLTATRIAKLAKREMMLTRKRQTSLKQLKSARAEEFQAEISKDLDNIRRINDEANLMLVEAESRLRMIEAAGSREGSLADSELALKKLSARTAELPLALESAKMAREIRLELEKGDVEVEEPAE